VNLNRERPWSGWWAIALVIGALGGCGRDPKGVGGSGTIELDQVDVSSLVGGRISSMRVSEGDTVRAGDTLATLDRGEVVASMQAQVAEAARAQAMYRDQESGTRVSELRAAEAELEAAKAALAFAESELTRTESLARDGVVAAAELDRARSTRDSARARRDAATEKVSMLSTASRQNQIDAARAASLAANARLAGAKSNSRELVLTAPIAGVVLLRNAEAGEVVGPGVPLVTLGNPDHLWVRVFVAAPQIGKVMLGAPARVNATGFGSRAFTGRVVEIASRAEFTPRAALTEDERANLVFGVKIALDPTGGVLKPGLPADAHIQVPADGGRASR